MAQNPAKEPGVSAGASRARDVVTGSAPAPSAAELGTFSRRDLLDYNAGLVSAHRHVGALMAQAASEIANRSGADASTSIARREGFRSAEQLIANRTGGSTREAHQLVEVGRTLAAAEAPPGPRAQEVGPQLPEVARATREGSISSESAMHIISMARRVFSRVSTERIAWAEKLLVERAGTLNSYQVRDLVKRIEASLDREGLEAKEQRQFAERHLTVHEDADGMLVIRGRVDIVTGAPIKTAIDAMVSHAIRVRRESQDTVPDDRTTVQMAADALSALCAHAVTCDGKQLNGPATSIVVRMTLDDLQQRTQGLATVDGIAQPLTAGQIRRLAAEAELIPAVLGGQSEVLDLGRARRLFSKAQRMALVERDGGCASCGAPPGWCDAHHARWWKEHAGATDIDNGVLLCRSCHTRMHQGEWQVRIEYGRVEFIPPASVDPERRPRLGGRAAFDLVS